MTVVVRSAPYRPGIFQLVAFLAILCGTVLPGVATGQSTGEILDAWILDVGADEFGCSAGTGCTLRYRIYHVATGRPEINLGPGLDGYPRYRKRGAYQTDSALSGNFPGAAGKWDIPFFVVWDGVLNPGSSSHVGYYGAQSQILSFGEVGDSSQMNCHGGQKAVACFEPLTSQNTALSLAGGLSAIGGLAPIPVPRLISSTRNSVSLEWEQAGGLTVTDGAPSALAGYRLYAFAGRDPSQSALSSARMVAELQSIGNTRATIQREHPGLPGSGDVTFVLKLVYVGNLESLYFSANSQTVELEGEDEEGEDDEDSGDEDPDEDTDPDGENPEDESRAAGDEPAGTGPAGTASGATSAGGLAPTAAGSAVLPGGGTAGSPGGGGSDPDGDEIAVEVDNCAGLWNPEQEDTDGDGSGDACDGDADGDDIPDDLDCDAGNPAAGLAALPPPSHLEVGTRPDHLFNWAAADGDWMLYRGRREPEEPFGYNHVCLAGNLQEGQADDATVPPPGGMLYYLVTGDSGCGAAPPGHRSGGGLRPIGPACLLVEMKMEDPGMAAAGAWSFRARGGGDLPVELEIRLPATGRLSHLHAVSLSIAYPPQSLVPVGSPVPGPLLAEEQAPARVDVSSREGEGRLQVTIARTGLGGSRQEEGQEATLVTLRWRQLQSGPVELRLDDIQVLDDEFSSLPMPGGSIRISMP